jgi:hypothetical protein
VGRLIKALVALVAVAIAVPAAAQEPVNVVYATIRGARSLDADARGGNPFASALIDVLRQPGGDVPERLLRGTLDYSDGEQGADVDALPPDATLAPREGETARALVIVFADYGSDDGLDSLPGAAFDAARVAAALESAGYSTRMVIARSAAEYAAELVRFERVSAAVDRALIYTTGHGSEAHGTIYLLPPELDGPDIATSAPGAIKVAEVGGSLRARKANWLIYAGCRDNPFNW